MPVEFFKNKQTSKHLRSKKVEQLYLEAVNKALLHDLQLPDETMITVTKAKMNESLTYLDLTISAYGHTCLKDVIIFLEGQKGYLKAYFAKHINMKYTPEIRFHADKSIEETLKWENLTLTSS